jgi:hypothetical protein
VKIDNQTAAIYRVSVSLDPVSAAQKHELHGPERLHVEALLGLAKDLLARAILVARVYNAPAVRVFGLKSADGTPQNLRGCSVEYVYQLQTRPPPLA